MHARQSILIAVPGPWQVLKQLGASYVHFGQLQGNYLVNHLGVGGHRFSN